MSPVRVALLMSLCACLSEGKAVSEDLLEVKSASGADCTLQCVAKAKSGVQYRAVRWYKVRESPSLRLSGLLTRDLLNGTTRFYTGVERQVELQVESRGIFLPNVTCADAGVYECHLAAPVGEQNREGRVLLTLTDCPDSLTQELMTDTYMVLLASALLVLALVIFLISYGNLKNVLKDGSKTTKKEILLDAPLKPLDKKDLMLIYTLGPKSPTLKHVCV